MASELTQTVELTVTVKAWVQAVALGDDVKVTGVILAEIEGGDVNKLPDDFRKHLEQLAKDEAENNGGWERE